MSWAGIMGLQLVEALFWTTTLSFIAFLARCSFFFILQYSRLLLRKSSSDSPEMGFGGTMVLIGAGLVGLRAMFIGLWIWVQGIFIWLSVESRVWPGGSMGCRLMVESGLSGGFRAGREGEESVLVDIHSCGCGTSSFCRTSWTLGQSECEGPVLLLFCSLLGKQETLMMGNLLWSLSGDCLGLHVVGLTTRTVGVLTTAVREAIHGLGWIAGFARRFTPLTVWLTVRFEA